MLSALFVCQYSVYVHDFSVFWHAACYLRQYFV